MKERPPLLFPSICHLSLPDGRAGLRPMSTLFILWPFVAWVKSKGWLLPERFFQRDLRRFLDRQKDPLKGFSIVNLSRAFLDLQSNVPCVVRASLLITILHLSTQPRYLCICPMAGKCMYAFLPIWPLPFHSHTPNFTVPNCNMQGRINPLFVLAFLKIPASR